MNLLKKSKKTLFLLPIAGIMLLTLVAFKTVDFKTSKSLEIFFSFFRELSIFYVDKTDPEKLIQVGIDAMLESLDPFNEFIPEENIETLEFQTTGEYGGMGALIRRGEIFPIIAEVYEGSPAHKAGIMAGDIIKWINGVSVKNMAVDKVSKLLKGVPKTPINVIVNRYGQTDSLVFNFNRDKIHIPSVPYFELLNNDIGYIRLANFTSNCHKEVESALKDLTIKRKAKGIILDLRGNPGGLLYEAVQIVNLFVDKNQLVVYTQGQIKDFDQKYKTQSRAVNSEIPLIILVDRVSASASEIVAGALQDLDRAVVIGERTFGKGLVQATRPLPYNTQLKITTAKYYIPSGRCIQAVDFTQRNEDGSIGFIPDSLVSEFKTKNGRIVLDGGGITPDIENTVSLYSRISSTLFARNMFFNYATLFRSRNSGISSPNDFSLSNEEYNAFIDYLTEQNFEYRSETELQLQELITASKQEKYYDLAKGIIDSLETTLANNRMKDLHFFSDEIKILLETEIIGRFFLQRGKAEFGIKHDDLISFSIDIISDSKKYNSILDVGFNAEPEINHTSEMLLAPNFWSQQWAGYKTKGNTKQPNLPS